VEDFVEGEDLGDALGIEFFEKGGAEGFEHGR
jgi:hypothetical protein